MATVRSGLLAAVLVGLVLPAMAQAQGNAPTADQLEQRAQALHSAPPMYAVAAGLYKRAASLRAGDVDKAVDDLEMAGRLYSYAGEASRGRAAMEEAAELALEYGDVVTAANDYADAAFIAASQHSVRAADLAKRVLWLADTAPIAPEQRDEIRGRLGPKVIATLRQQAGDVTGA